MVAFARDRYTLRAEELNRLMAKADRGLTPSLELSTARLDLFEAESQWIDGVTELRLEQVRLEQAQGLLSTSALAAVPSAEMPRH
jgi:outer membrane protein TolC